MAIQFTVVWFCKTGPDDKIVSMTLRPPRTLAISLLLVSLLLVACAGEALPTLVPTAEPPPDPPPTAAAPAAPLPPPAIITVPAGAFGSAAFELPANGLSAAGLSPQVVIQSGTEGAIPPEVQRLLDDLASGAILLNSSPAGPDGQSVDYAYRDLNQDGVRDLVVFVVAEAAGQAGSSQTELEGEPVQAFGINLDALVQSISQDPSAPVLRSAFIYPLSQDELERVGRQ